MKVVRVRPYQDSLLENLRTVLSLHYTDCGIENVRDFPHGGQNSDIKLVDLVIRDKDISHTVTALIKTVNLSASHRLVGCQLTRFMTREVLFYTEIFPSLLRDNPGRLGAVIPKCYYGQSDQLDLRRTRSAQPMFSCLSTFCSLETEDTGMLVLEDLTRRRDKVTVGLERSALMDLRHVEAALESLAHFHGSAWRWRMGGLSASSPRKENPQLRELQRLHTDSCFLEFCFKTIFRMIRKMLRTFLENRKENSLFVARLDDFMKNEIFKVMKVMWSNKSQSKYDTLVHGSFWSSNILFQYPSQGGGPEKALLVDFQQIGLGDPCRDILSLLYTNTTAAFRAKHTDTLLQNYFNTLRQYFKGFFFMSSSNYQEFSQKFSSCRRFGLAWGLYMICVGKTDDNLSTAKCNENFLVLFPETKTGWKNELNIKEVLEKRFEKISSTSPNVAPNYLDIRVRLMDLLREAKCANVI